MIRLNRRQFLKYMGLFVPAPKLMPTALPLSAEQQEPIYQLPFNAPPGPSTWYVEQWYGNTNIAYYLRNTTYREGQGIHFGIDFACPCETEIRAIGDGVVVGADDLSFGADPTTPSCAMPTAISHCTATCAGSRKFGGDNWSKRGISSAIQATGWTIGAVRHRPISILRFGGRTASMR